MRLLSSAPGVPWVPPVGRRAAFAKIPFMHSAALAPPNPPAKDAARDVAAGQRPAVELDDWSGGFDVHLGVYTDE